MNIQSLNAFGDGHLKHRKFTCRGQNTTKVRKDLNGSYGKNPIPIYKSQVHLYITTK